MQAVKSTFVQTDLTGEPAKRHWSAKREICPGQFVVALAQSPINSARTPMFVQDKTSIRSSRTPRRARHYPPRTEGIDAAVGGTSGAKSRPSKCAKAGAPSHRRVDRGTSAGLLAAQLRRFALETSRALLLLPPSLVRSGALRSDIYPQAPAPGCRAGARS